MISYGHKPSASNTRNHVKGDQILPRTPFHLFFPPVNHRHEWDAPQDCLKLPVIPPPTLADKSVDPRH
jgi:hypothetical protein